MEQAVVGMKPGDSKTEKYRPNELMDPTTRKWYLKSLQNRFPDDAELGQGLVPAQEGDQTVLQTGVLGLR
jgi:hypothetical protein